MRESTESMVRLGLNSSGYGQEVRERYSLSRDSVLPQGFAKAFSGAFAYVLGLRIVVRAVTSVLAP